MLHTRRDATNSWARGGKDLYRDDAMSARYKISSQLRARRGVMGDDVETEVGGKVEPPR